MNKKMEIIFLDDEELEMTDLNERDIDYHRWYLNKVYAGMLREADVIDKCTRIFRNTFRNIYLILF